MLERVSKESVLIVMEGKIAKPPRPHPSLFFCAIRPLPLSTIFGGGTERGICAEGREREAERDREKEIGVYVCGYHAV